MTFKYLSKLDKYFLTGCLLSTINQLLLTGNISLFENTTIIHFIFTATTIIVSISMLIHTIMYKFTAITDFRIGCLLIALLGILMFSGTIYADNSNILTINYISLLSFIIHLILLRYVFVYMKVKSKALDYYVSEYHLNNDIFKYGDKKVSTELVDYYIRHNEFYKLTNNAKESIDIYNKYFSEVDDSEFTIEEKEDIKSELTSIIYTIVYKDIDVQPITVKVSNTVVKDKKKQRKDKLRQIEDEVIKNYKDGLKLLEDE